MKFSIYLLAIAASLFFYSCDTFKDISIEKRHYRNGYYVHVRDSKSSEGISEKAEPSQEKTAVSLVVPEEKTSVVVEKTTQEKPVSKTEMGFGNKNTTKNSSHPFQKKSGRIIPRPSKLSFPNSHKLSSEKADDDENAVALFLLIILAIFVPPLAVILKDGLGLPFILDLIFWLLGFGFVIFIAGTGFIYLGIFGLIAIIYALLIVLDVI